VADLVAQFQERGMDNALEQFPKATTYRDVNGQTYYILISGHRRWTAWQIAFPGEPIPLAVKPNITDKDLIFGSLAENLTRQAASDVEYGRAIKTWLDKDPQMSLAKLSKLFNLAKPTLSNYLKLTKLPLTLQEENRLGRLTVRMGYALVRFEEAGLPGAAEYAYQLVQERNITAEEAEKAGWRLLADWPGWEAYPMPPEAAEVLVPKISVYGRPLEEIESAVAIPTQVAPVSPPNLVNQTTTETDSHLAAHSASGDSALGVGGAGESTAVPEETRPFIDSPSQTQQAIVAVPPPTVITPAPAAPLLAHQTHQEEAATTRPLSPTADAGGNAATNESLAVGASERGSSTPVTAGASQAPSNNDNIRLFPSRNSNSNNNNSSNHATTPAQAKIIEDWLYNLRQEQKVQVQLAGDTFNTSASAPMTPDMLLGFQLAFSMALLNIEQEVIAKVISPRWYSLTGGTRGSNPTLPDLENAGEWVVKLDPTTLTLLTAELWVEQRRWEQKQLMLPNGNQQLPWLAQQIVQIDELETPNEKEAGSKAAG
jgi:hypothetical protein